MELELAQGPCICGLTDDDGMRRSGMLAGFVIEESTHLPLYFISHPCPHHGMYDESDRATTLVKLCNKTFLSHFRTWLTQHRRLDGDPRLPMSPPPRR